MNYIYGDQDDKPKQPVGYTIQIGGPPQPPQQEEIPNQYISKAMVENAHNGRMRNIFAEARIKEGALIVQGMREIRSALNLDSMAVADGDTGSKDRPPLEKAFDDINLGKLQECYLRMAERLINHTEFFLRKELGTPLTNEIKLQPPKDERIS